MDVGLNDMSNKLSNYQTGAGFVDPTGGVLSAVQAGGAIFDGVMNLVGNIFNWNRAIKMDSYNIAQNEYNKQFAREQFDYQKQLNNLLMEREDNAIQRRMADLKAAGINPNLAAGQPAQASVGTVGGSPSASQVSMNKFERLSSALALMQSIQSLKTQQAQQALTQAEVISRKLDNKIKPIVKAKEIVALQNEQKDGIMKDIKNLDAENERIYNQKNRQRQIDSGIYDSDPGYLKGVRGVSNVLTNGIDTIVDSVKGLTDKPKPKKSSKPFKTQKKSRKFKDWFDNRIESINYGLFGQ